MTPTKPISMSREFLPHLVTRLERDKARDSVTKSMARLFPCHTYKREDIAIGGKLTVVTYHFEYSKLKALKQRFKSWMTGLRSTPQSSS